MAGTLDLRLSGARSEPGTHDRVRGFDDVANVAPGRGFRVLRCAKPRNDSGRSAPC
jgi:hypothetical protein